MSYIPPEKIKALKARMKGNWFEYFQYCVPDLDEAVHAHPKHVPCPIHGGSDGFRLFDDAEDTGGGICNTCGGFKDGIGLAQAVTDWSFFEAIESIEEWLLNEGEDDDPPEKIENEAKPVEYDDYALRYIDRVIDQAITSHERIKRYFVSRGITNDPPDCIGLMLNEKYKDEYEDLELPVMVALFHNQFGDPVCVHRTYLDPDGDGKADVEKPKKFSKVIYPGALRGGAIRLRDHFDDGLLGVAEGIETAEAVFQATKVPTWATIGTSNLASFIPPPDVTKLIIWADNDANKAGQNAAEKLRKRLEGSGVKIRICTPPDVGTDWLDVLVKYGEAGFIKIAKKVMSR